MKKLHPFAPKRACSHKKRWRRDSADWLWCYQMHGLLERTGRAGTHERTVVRITLLFPGSYEEDLVHLCRWRETTERTCGRISGKRWRKDEWLQDRLPECNRSTNSSVCTEHLQDGRHYGLQHRCHILSESDRPGLCPTGARGKWTSLCVTGEGYALSINLWRGSVAWIPSSCKSSRKSWRKGTGPSVYTRRRRDRWIVKKKTQMGKTCALTHHCTAVVSETLTQAITLDKLQQITCRQAPRHQALIHDSHWVQCRIPSQISCPHQFDVMNMFPMSRSDVDDLRKDECLQLMEQLGEAQLRRGVLVMELKAMIKDLLFSEEDGQEQPLLGLAKMNRSQLADKARQLNIPTAESHTKGHSIRLKRENRMQQSTPVGSELSGIRQAWSQDVSGGPEVGSRILPMDRPRGGSTIPLETPEVLFVADDAACSPGTEPGKQYDTGTPDETHQTTRGRELVRQQHWRRKIWRWRSKFGNWWNKCSFSWSLRKSVAGRDRQRVLRNGRRPKEKHDEYYEVWRDGLGRRTSTTQSQSTTLKRSNDFGEEPWWIGWRLFACVFCTFRHFLISDHYKPSIPEKTSASVKHILPKAERHRHTVLERRARFGGHRIRLPTWTFSLSLSVSTPIYPSHIFILQRQHGPRVASLGPRERWTPMKTRTHDDAALRDHSSRFGNVGPTYEQMTRFAFIGRQQPNGLQEGVERVSTRSWVFTCRCRIMLGPGTTRLTTLGNSGMRQGRDPRVTSPSQSADMSYCTIATKTLRFEELREDSCVAKQTVWPSYNTCLGK